MGALHASSRYSWYLGQENKNVALFVGLVDIYYLDSALLSVIKTASWGHSHLNALHCTWSICFLYLFVRRQYQAISVCVCCRGKTRHAKILRIEWLPSKLFSQKGCLQQNCQFNFRQISSIFVCFFTLLLK